MRNPFYAVILAGGKGERFWPLSTAQRPKQLLSLVGKKPLLVQAVDRLRGVVPHRNIFIITSRDLVPATRKLARGLPPANIIGEPMGRDTAAAVALGAALVKRRNPDGVFCVLTADHVIGNLPVFRQTLREALSLAARQDILITIGIRPRKPSTGYGYIEAGPVDLGGSNVTFRKARRFVEKPDLKKAKKYLAAGLYFWNSGMFIWSTRSIINAFRKYRPSLYKLIQKLESKTLSRTLRREYPRLEKISIDYAVMEKASNIVMAEGRFAWDDVGSWPSLENHFAADRDRNVLVGNTAVVDAAGNIVFSEERMTALLGVRNLVVVQAPGVTLVCRKDKAQDIKKLVELIRSGRKNSEVL